MKKCRNCGYEGDSNFCPECGSELIEVSEEVEKDIRNNEEEPQINAVENNVGKKFFPINKRTIVVTVIAVLVVLLTVYLMIPLNRATFDSVEDMKSACSGTYAYIDNDICTKYLVVNEDGATLIYDYSYANASDASLDLRAKKWNNNRGFLNTPVGKIIFYKDGTAKLKGEEYSYYSEREIVLDKDKEETDSENEKDAQREKRTATTGEDNALKSAESYLQMSTGFSEKGLREQLAFEGYVDSEVDYAIDNCGADWKEQCKKSAESYLSGSMSFSKEGLIEQLVFEGYADDMAREIVEEVY